MHENYHDLIGSGEDLHQQLEETKDLVKKIRSNKKFNNKKELIKQMKKDEKIARKYFFSG